MPAPVDEEKRVAGCEGKAGFDSQASASRVAKQTRRRHDHKPLGPYHCPACGRWHIGMKKGKR